MAQEAQKKGLNLIATGDALHSKWLELLEEQLIQEEDTEYTLQKIHRQSS